MVTINHERNKKYFRQAKYKGGVTLIIIGLLFLLGGDAVPVIIGLLLIAGGAALLYRQIAGRPSDQEIDEQAAALRTGLRQQALDKLGLDEDQVKLIDPIVVGGYHFGSLGKSVGVKKGKDGAFRSSNIEGVVMYFGEHELHSYKRQLSLTEPDERRESTDEYFYRDVVSVATQSQTMQVPVIGNAPQTVNFELFRLTTSGGTSVESTVNDVSDTVNRTVHGARQLIRDRKMLG